MKCPNCKKEMEKVNFDMGYNVNVESLHCKNCGFNITEEKKLNNAVSALRINMSKDIKIISIGEGLGVRLPNEIVKIYNLKKGKTVSLMAEKNGLKMML